MLWFCRRQPLLSLARALKSFMSIKVTACLIASIGAAVMCAFHLGSAGAQSSKIRYQQDIAQTFTNHEDLKLDARSAVDEVRQSGHLSIRTAARNFELDLRPNDLRSPRYRAQENAGGVEHELPKMPISIFKGTVDGIPGADARFTIDGNKVEGMILTPGEIYFVEPARKYSAAADTSDYLLYAASDVRPDITRSCGDTLDEQISKTATQFSSSSATIAPDVFSPFRVAEIATEADSQYVSALGGSTAANNDILSIMNSIQAVYERDIGLSFTVAFQHTWTTTDPFSTTGSDPQPAVNLLNSFTNYWNANFTNINRDDAHLWTGKNLGGPSGVAFTSVVCLSPTAAYGLSDLETISPFRVGIPAHEIGHNFGAHHCDGQAGCDNTIMVGTQTQSNTLTFCAFSINEITTYVSANGGCLSQPASGPVIQFDQANYVVNEGAARATITVNRTGNTGGTSAVGFITNDAAGLQPCSTINGTASPRCDYTNVIGTLQFAAGETSKTITVPIIDDSYAEGSESFTVSLNNVSGATLGTPFTTNITIQDNDPVNGPNPIDNTRFFVRQQYLDFLGREPDEPSWTLWANGIDSCSGDVTQCDRVHVSQLFYQSNEFQSRGYYVFKFYPVSFPGVAGTDPPGAGHKSDYAQFALDLAAVSGFLSPAELEAAKDQFAVNFVARPAFAARYGSLNSTQYVDTLLSTAGVTSTFSSSTRQSLINGLNGGTLTRAQVLRQIVDSAEVSARYFNEAYVVMEYFGYLRRDPDTLYLNWLDVINQTNDPRGMVIGFVTSVEYRQRFGPP